MSENAERVGQDPLHQNSNIADADESNTGTGDRATSQLQLNVDRGIDYERIVAARLESFRNGRDEIPF